MELFHLYKWFWIGDEQFKLPRARQSHTGQRRLALLLVNNRQAVTSRYKPS